MFKFKTTYKKILADTITPVSLYLKIRDKFPNSLLLESSDYNSADNSFSYLCFNPISKMVLHKNTLHTYLPGKDKTSLILTKHRELISKLNEYRSYFKTDQMDFPFLYHGLFGYMGYDVVRYFESVDIQKTDEDNIIPDMVYSVYKNVLAINHLNNEAYLFCHSLDNDNNLNEVLDLIHSWSFPRFSFRKKGNEEPEISDYDYLEKVEIAKKHCQRGDVFQMVLSRRFEQNFTGDEFNVYRQLRSINPSPYLFYFDYGDYKIFGSSPEAQLIVKGKSAEIHPIAGTFKRTGNDNEDLKLAEQLKQDTKENAEHVMLVDLARNDLSRHGRKVTVENYRDIQFFSHVIHMVSKVKADITNQGSSLDIVADTFPAGTLSGAPKIKAMELIEKYENSNRSFYGGCIGYMSFDGDFNHAIIIRSFISRDNVLCYQAGAGIVSKSVPQNELMEINNKIAALRKAINLADKFNEE